MSVENSQLEDLESDIQIFNESLEHQAVQPPNDDPYIASWAHAARNLMEESPLWRAKIEGMFRWRRESMKRPIDPHIAPNLVFRATHKKALHMRGPEEYPIKFDVNQWMRLIQEFLADQDLSDDFEEDIDIRTVQSNIPERYKMLKLLIKLFPERFGEQPKIVDVGSSLNLGLTKLALSDTYPFGEVVVVDSSDEASENQALTKAVNGLIASNLAIGSSFGIDMWNFPNDKPLENWTITNSLLPKELVENPKIRQELEELATLHPAEVGFYWGDITNRESMKNFPPALSIGQLAINSYRRPVKNHEDMKFDMGSMVTMLYLLDARRRQLAIKRTREYLLPNSPIIVQDFVKVVRGKPNQMRFEKDIYVHKWLYRTLVLDPLNPEGVQEAFISETGRCERIMIGNGRIMVDGELKSISQAVSENTTSEQSP